MSRRVEWLRSHRSRTRFQSEYTDCSRDCRARPPHNRLDPYRKCQFGACMNTSAQPGNRSGKRDHMGRRVVYRRSGKRFQPLSIRSCSGYGFGQGIRVHRRPTHRLLTLRSRQGTRHTTLRIVLGFARRIRHCKRPGRMGIRRYRLRKPDLPDRGHSRCKVHIHR